MPENYINNTNILALTTGINSTATSLSTSALPSAPLMGASPIQFVQSEINLYGSNPWTTNKTVTAGNLLVVAISGLGGGTITLADNLGTTYTNAVTEYIGSSGGGTSTLWYGVISTTGSLVLTIGGTFGVAPFYTGADVPGGEIYFVELANFNPSSPIGGTVTTSGSGTVTASLSVATAGSMIIGTSNQVWNNVGAWIPTSPVVLYHVDYYASAFFGVLSPGLGANSFSITNNGGGATAMAAMVINGNPNPIQQSSYTTPSVIQSATGTSAPWTTGLTVTMGNLLLVAQIGQGSGTAAITDNLGTTYHQVEYTSYAGAGNYGTLYFWYGFAPSSGAITISHTGTFAVTGSFGGAGGQFYLAEIANVDPNVPIRQSNNTGSSISTTQPYVDHPITYPGDLLFYGAVQTYNINPWAAVSGTTILQQLSAQSVFAYGTASTVAPGTTTIGTTVTGSTPYVFSTGISIKPKTTLEVTNTDGNFRVLIDSEILFVNSGATTTTWNIARGMENTVATSHGAGAAINAILTAGALDAVRFQISGAGTYANLPTSGMKLGDTYTCTDSPFDFYYNGTGWQSKRGRPYPWLPLNSSDFTNYLGGGATASFKGVLNVYAPASVGSANFMWNYSLPPTPWTISLQFYTTLFPYNYNTTGMYLTNGSYSSNWVVQNNSGNGGICLDTQHFSGNASGLTYAGESAHVIIGGMPSGLTTLKIQNDGTYRRYYVGFGSDDITQAASVVTLSATDYFTPTGVFLQTNAANYDISTQFVSFRVDPILI